MEQQNNHNAWPFTQMVVGGSSNHTCYMADAHQNQYYNLANAGNETPYVHTTFPHCIYCQQIPQNYVDFLTQSGAYETQNELPFGNTPVPSGFRSIELSFDKVGNRHQIICQGPCNEEAPRSDLTGSECQTASQNSSEGYSPAASAFPSAVPCKKSREKASDADRRRRLRISEGLDALQELLPHPKKGGKCSVVDDIIDHIKYLQLQIKELSQRRLGVESSCTPLIFIEGFGHYLLSNQVQNEPLEEMIGKLLEVNPSAATQLLESRGLCIKPMAFAEGLHPQT